LSFVVVVIFSSLVLFFFRSRSLNVANNMLFLNVFWCLYFKSDLLIYMRDSWIVELCSTSTQQGQIAPIISLRKSLFFFMEDNLNSFKKHVLMSNFKGVNLCHWNIWHIAFFVSTLVLRCSFTQRKSLYYIDFSIHQNQNLSHIVI